MSVSSDPTLRTGDHVVRHMCTPLGEYELSTVKLEPGLFYVELFARVHDADLGCKVPVHTDTGLGGLVREANDSISDVTALVAGRGRLVWKCDAAALRALDVSHEVRSIWRRHVPWKGYA